MVIDGPKHFEQYTFTVNDTPDHSFESRLERVSLSKGKYRKAMYPMMMEIKKNHFKEGTYGFIFNEFTVIAIWDTITLNTVTLLKRQWRNNMKDLKVKYMRRIIGFHK